MIEQRKLRKILMSLLLLLPAFALADQIDLYLDCPADHQDCIALPMQSDASKVLRLQREPSLTITESDLADVGWTDNEKGTELFIVRLHPEATKTLAEVTSKNLNRTLALVVDHRVVVAPKIVEAITAGRFQVPGGPGGWKSIPWLNEEAKKRSTSEAGAYIQLLIMLLAASAIVAGGSIWSRKRRRAIRRKLEGAAE